MAINERSRHELYLRLEELLGGEPANTLMEHLPPLGWADVATKRDLDALEAKLLGAFRAELASQTRTMFVAIVTIVFTMSGLVLALAR